MPPKLETRQQLSKHMISFSNEGKTTTHAIYLSWLNPLNCTSLHAVMSYAYTPSSGANTDSTHATWQQRKTNTQASVADKINNIISSHDQGGLPMYKDKPYNYASSGRKRPFYQQKRLMLALLGVLTWILYFVGAFSSGTREGSGETRGGNIWKRLCTRGKETPYAAARATGFVGHHPCCGHGVHRLPANS